MATVPPSHHAKPESASHHNGRPMHLIPATPAGLADADGHQLMNDKVSVTHTSSPPISRPMQPDAATPGDAQQASLEELSPTSQVNVNQTAYASDHLDQNALDTPPFWTRHGRSISTVSYQSISQHRQAPILLEDHSEEHHEQTQACWARSVTIDDYVIVTGATGIGAYVVWQCTVSTLKGGDMQIRKRYSEFDQLRQDLIRAFPHADAMIPSLPRKSVVSRFRPKFLDQRQAGLGHFMNCILLNPEFAASPVLKAFIFS